jgi:translation initiation factor IF-1
MDNALQAIIVIDGRIAGSWRRIIQKDNVIVELKPFRPLDESARRLVRAAAEHYAEFLGLQLRLE